MSSNASEGVGKLVVRIAENGHSYKLDSDENTLVESVQKLLESACGIRFNDQLLLCLDLKLESHCPLSAYKLPSDVREVFLFNKARMRSSSPNPSPERVEIIDIPNPISSPSSHNPHPLDDSADPALKSLPSYERLFRHHFECGQAIHERTLAKMEGCERLVQEVMVQERALEIARGSLDHFFKMIVQNYSEFVKCYSYQHRNHTSLLVNFEREIERLRSIRIMPVLQTGDRKCLLDFVKEKSLRKTVEDCSNSHRQFENKVLEFKQEFGDLKRNTDDLFSGKTSFLIKDLGLSIKDHQRFIHEQESRMQALSKDVNTAKKLVDDCISCQQASSLRPHDAVSALGRMYDNHDKTHLPKMQECERALTNFLDFCTEKKNEMNIFVNNYMQKIAYIQYTVKDVRYKFSVFQEALKRENEQFEPLKVMRGVGPAYRACLAEVVRRKAALKIFMGKAGQLAEKLAIERDLEVKRRDEFLKVNSNYIPRDVLGSMGLYDTPSPCDVNVMPYDSKLLDIDLSDMDRYAPESLLGVASKRGTSRSLLSISGDGSEERREASELMESSGTGKMEVENARLKAELASKIALICSMSTELDYESLEESKLDSLLKNVTEKTFEAIHLKDEYEKHLISMLKAKQMQCESYEKRIQELEQRPSAGEGLSNILVSNAKSDDNMSSAQKGLDDNMTDSSSKLNSKLDSSMLDLNRDKGQFFDKDKKETPLSDGGPLGSSSMAVSISKPEGGDVKLGSDGKVCDSVETRIKALVDEVSKLGRELEINQKLLNESQMKCAHLENCLHEARKETQMHLCTADRTASQYSALRVSADKTHSLFERLRSCVSSSDVAAFPDSLRSLAQSLASSANESNDQGIAEFHECIQILVDKVGVLSRQREELLDGYSKAEAANEKLNKELGEKKELVNTLYVKHQHEKQANKEKISFGRIEVHEITAFVLNTSGHYEAINRKCPYYYLSSESVALFTDHLASRPSYIVGQVVHIERQIVKPPDLVDNKLTLKQRLTLNPYGLPVGCEYFIVTVAMLPDIVHSPSPPTS